MSGNTPDSVTVTLSATEVKDFSDGAIASDGSVANGNNVSFVNLTYTVQEHPFKSLFKKVPRKAVLDDISGSMGPGLNAIMGPSGSGKTLLLDVLADRKAKKGLSGHVLINGKWQPINFRSTSAYVVQEDVLMAALTVRENIAFSAALRLPMSVSGKERAEKVETIINELGLSHVDATRVGKEYFRNISKGERKLTSIGMELIISPSIIFLDGPTTGLDALAAESVVRILKNFSCNGRVVIMSIHQPQYPIYDLFDSLTLMSQGHIVYHGPAANALSYFAKHGYQCKQHNNPADYFLKVILENEATNEIKSANVSTVNQVNSETNAPAGQLANIYTESREFITVKQQLDQRLNVARNEAVRRHPPYTTNFLWQCGVVGLNTGRTLFRNRHASGLQVAVIVTLGFLIGLVFLQVHDDYIGVQDRIGAMFLIIAMIAVINIPFIRRYLREKQLFVHQNASGYYRVSAFFLTKVFCYLIPIRVTPVLLFCTITYWMIGFEADIGKFFFYMLTLALLSSTASTLVYAISARVPVVTAGTMFLSVVFIQQLMFAGYLRNLNSARNYVAWIQYFSMFRHALNAIAVNEFEGNEYPSNCNITAETVRFSCVIGDDLLDLLDYSINPWFNILALFILNCFFLLMAYINLRLLKKEK